MEDETEGVPLAGADQRHAVPDRGRGPAPRGAHWPLAGGEEIAATERERGNRATRLRARTLLHEQSRGRTSSHTLAFANPPRADEQFDRVDFGLSASRLSVSPR